MRASSSTLSYLFARGTISAEFFLSDEKFREFFYSKINKSAEDPHIHPDPRKYSIIYAIINYHSSETLNLPFFSKLNLIRSARYLKMLGFTVFLVEIKTIIK